MSQEISTGDPGLHTEVLDHAAEFVVRVAGEAPDEYRRMLELDSVRQALADDNAFNRGKLYAWAEFLVFRREFRARFPEATREDCINAFCKLFLKNDISISNLVDYFEQSGHEELRLLQQKGSTDDSDDG